MMRSAEKRGFKEFARGPFDDVAVSVRGEPLERIQFAISRGEWLARGGGGP